MSPTAFLCKSMYSRQYSSDLHEFFLNTLMFEFENQPGCVLKVPIRRKGSTVATIHPIFTIVFFLVDYPSSFIQLFCIIKMAAIVLTVYIASSLLQLTNTLLNVEDENIRIRHANVTSIIHCSSPHHPILYFSL